MKFLPTTVALIILIGVIFAGASNLEDKRTQRIIAQEQLLRTQMLKSSQDRLFSVMGLGLLITGSAVVILLIAVTWPKPSNENVKHSSLTHVTHNHYYLVQQSKMPGPIKYLKSGRK